MSTFGVEAAQESVSELKQGEEGIIDSYSYQEGKVGSSNGKLFTSWASTNKYIKDNVSRVAF